jgi:membrane protein DedA with SNARE-associated domain
MDIAAWGQSVLDLIEANAGWAGPITFALAFGESMVLLGLILPATVVLAGAGVLAGWGVLDFWTLVIWGAPGAFLGDAVSFWLGRRCGPFILGLWPMSRRPELVEQGRRFFLRHGGKSVFIGRFFGPLRAMVPLIAGMMHMGNLRFQLANGASAILWIIGILAPGAMVGFGLEEMVHHQEKPVGYVTLALGVVVAAVLFVWLKRQI